MEYTTLLLKVKLYGAHNTFIESKTLCSHTTPLLEVTMEPHIGSDEKLGYAVGYLDYLKDQI